MGKYTVKLVGTSREDLKEIYMSGNKVLVRKIEILFVELSEHPQTGTGKPEVLKHQPGVWSRRLDKKNRMLYSIFENTVTVYVLSVKSHYGDK